MLLERCRREVSPAAMMGVEGRLPRGGRVVHAVAERVAGLSDAVRRIGPGPDGAIPVRLPQGRGDRVRGGHPFPRPVDHYPLRTA